MKQLRSMKRLRKQTLDGNVETLLLGILESGPSYGYAIIQELSKRAEGIVGLGEGTVYPVLHRLEERRLITATWRSSEKGRARKYYRLTTKGKQALAENRLQWQMLATLMEKVAVCTGGLLPETMAKAVSM
jgi:DNA-binding PadR family transcriptional regulator